MDEIASGARVKPGNGTARFHRTRGDTREAEVLFDDGGGVGEGAVWIAHPLSGFLRDVATEVGIEDRRSRTKRVVDIEDGRELLIIDLHEICDVFGRIGIAREDDCNRLPGVAGNVAGQHRVMNGSGTFEQIHRRQRAEVKRQVRGAHAAKTLGLARGRAEVDPRDTGVGMLGTDHAHDRHSRLDQVGQVLRRAGQQRRILAPSPPLSKSSRLCAHPASDSMAAMMLVYPVQRQRCPLRCVRIAARLGAFVRARKMAVDTKSPGVQKPHCSACCSRKAACNGVSPSALGKPPSSAGKLATVWIRQPSACTASIKQALAGCPSMTTVQAPHMPWPQPIWTPVARALSRRKSLRRSRGRTNPEMGLSSTVMVNASRSSISFDPCERRPHRPRERRPRRRAGSRPAPLLVGIPR